MGVADFQVCIYIYITWKTLNIWKPNHNNLTWDLWKNSPGITQLHLTTWRCLKNWGYPKSAVSMEKTRFRNIGFMKWTGKKWKLVTSLLASPMGPLHPSPSPWSEYVLSLCPRQHSDLHLGGTFEVAGPNDSIMISCYCMVSHLETTFCCDNFKYPQFNRTESSRTVRPADPKSGCDELRKTFMDTFARCTISTTTSCRVQASEAPNLQNQCVWVIWKL